MINKQPQGGDTRARFPSEDEIAARALELFFRDRDAPQAFADCWRAAEDELLDRAARQAIKRASR